jgi:murein DD-endopeptidase MepM/ murein hydrolase activator NlpD
VEKPLKAIYRVRGTILLLGICYLSALVTVRFLLNGGSEKAEEAVELQPSVEMVIVDTLRAGDTIDELFQRRGFTYPELFEIMRSSREYYNLNRVNAGAVLSVGIDEGGTITDFRCSIDDSRILVVRKQDGEYTSTLEDIPYEVSRRYILGEIESSLYETFIEMGENPSLSAALSEVFAWQVDFNTDLRSGDSFRAIVEEKTYEGQQPHFSRVVAARMINRGRTLIAIRFEDPDDYVDYYDIEGKSLKRKFLRSPLRYTRVSSRYSKSRLHPILKIYRPHLGVDYAAPTGTPVVSVGEGVIAYAGWKRGFGRYVRIRHNSIYETTYGHLSRYARGIKKGKSVKQGQVIGYVGSTGLATGPHLDYRLTKHGSYINPLTVDLPSSDPVKNKYMGLFREHAINMLEQLDIADEGVTFTKKGTRTINDGG